MVSSKAHILSSYEVQSCESIETYLLTMFYHFQFLYEVSTHARVNKMNPYNIAVVVGPNIFPVNEKVVPKNRLIVKKVCDIIKVSVLCFKTSYTEIQFLFS